MSGGGVDWKQVLQNAEAALARAENTLAEDKNTLAEDKNTLAEDKKTCAQRETQYREALKKLEEHQGANPGDTDSVMYKMLEGALETARTAFESAQKQVEAQTQAVARTQTYLTNLAGQVQAPQVC